MVKAEKIKGVLGKLKFTKKKAAVLIVVAIAAAGISVWALKTRAAAQASAPMQKNIVRTVNLAKTTLTESVTVTGTVESTSVTNITSSQSYPISEILVKEGESVTLGQTLARLDTAELDKQIARSRESVAEATAKAQTAYDEAVTQRDTAYNNAIAAEGTLATALSAKQKAEKAYNSAKSSVKAFQTSYNEAAAAEKAAGTALNAANTALLKAPDDVDLQAAQLAAQAAYDAAVANTKTASDALNSAKAACGFDAAKQAYDTASQSYDGARNALTSMESLYENAVKSVTVSQEALNSAKESDSLTELIEKRESCEITATATGTVTNINAVAGSAPSQNSALFVIQDTENLKVSITVDEYDIKSISTGMKAKIKSDATGDAEISGTVSQISLTAQNASAGAGSSSSTGFGAEVTVDGTGSELLIGMNAKVEIIISEKADVFTVPYDAIGENENGESVVYKREGEDFAEVVVQKGMETDYYVEITSSSLQTGDVIRASASGDEIASSDEIAGNMQGGIMFGGMGGDMPSQGGGMAPPTGGGGGFPSGGNRG